MNTELPKIYLSAPHMGADERELMLDAFDSNWIAPLGPHVDAFEREIAASVGVGHAAALSSGTAALHLALEILGIGNGDEVLVPTLTFAASANAVLYTGATPHFIDSDPATWNIDAKLLEQALAGRNESARRIRALITVDLYGQCADYGAIKPICEHYRIPIIEDAAEALGATYGEASAGSLGELGVLSFNGNKILTTSGGGCLLSDRDDWIRRARFLSTQARDPAPHYQHSTLGYNYRLSNLLAAIGRGQLRHLEDRVAARRGTFDYYRERLGHLPGVTFMPEASYGRATHWLTCLLIDPTQLGVTREDVRKHLEHHRIEARPVWKPMHLQPVYAGYPATGGEIARRLFEHGLCLPSGSGLNDSDRDRVITAFLSTPGLS